MVLNYFKKQTQTTLETLSNYVLQKQERNPQNSFTQLQKEKARNARDSFKLLQKQDTGFSISFKLLQKEKTRGTRDCFKLLQKGKTRIPEILSNYFKKRQGIVEILSNYLKNMTRNSRDFLKLKKTTRGS